MRVFKFLLLSLGVLLAFPVGGTDGYFSIGYGPYNKSLAGAGVSMFNVSLIGSNPAGNAFLGNEYMIGVSLFNPVRSFEVFGAPSQQPNTFGLVPGKVESDAELFLIPALGANWLLGDRSVIGAAIYG
ncbi:MAG: hypothetical protein R3330_13405, partial [Saprospiraceae bacterium]|nr:hypothetical protein [Saprospiraceae bacterium]